MSKQQLLQQYRKDVENLRKCAKQLQLTDKEITGIFKRCFTKLNQQIQRKDNKTNKAQNYLRIIFQILISLIIILIIIYIILNVHQPTTSIVLRNVQGLIYPGFKFLRFLSVPIIKQFPRLTSLYDESCLITNPYFYVADMECWPCENVNSVIDLTGFNNYSLYQSAIPPYIVKIEQNEIDFNQLRREYYKNKHIYDLDANNIKLNGKSFNLNDLFDDDDDDDNKYKNLVEYSNINWRINRMLPGRLIRQLFPRPYNIITDRIGQSIERYIMIDGKQSNSYQLPNTECSYVFVIQGSGERIIILKPSKECGDKCRTISILLKPSHVLFYNWWYWRPISLSIENATQSSITYISSYC